MIIIRVSVLYNSTESIIDEDGELITQTLTYNRYADAKSIAISSPAHKDLQSLEVVMHAHTSGYWHTGSLEVPLFCLTLFLKCIFKE